MNITKVKTTNLRIYIDLLEVFYIGLTNGLIEFDEVNKWADTIITKDEQPDYFVIELSLCRNSNDMISIINEFVGEIKPVISARVILGLLYKQYVQRKIPLRKVTGAIYWLMWHKDLTDAEKGFMYGLDEDLDCAESGIYGSVEKVEKETLRFMVIYKEFTIDNFDKWAELDKPIEEKIDQLIKIVVAEKNNSSPV